MHQVLIVDDEKSVRDRLALQFPWQDLGFEVVDCAENGYDAIDLINSKTPDVILTDILMPKMSGLDLIRKINQCNPQLKVVIMSAYDDFKYAQEAIKLGVKGYLLKPILHDEFTQLFSKLKVELKQENTQQRDSSVLIPLLKESFSKDMEKPLLYLQQFGWGTLKHSFRTIVCSVELTGEDASDQNKLRLIYQEASQLCEQKKIPVLLHEKKIVLLIHSSEAMETQSIKSFIEALRQEIKHVCHTAGFQCTRLSIGVSNVYRNLEGLHQSYGEAVYASNEQFFSGNESIIFCQGIPNVNRATKSEKEIFQPIWDSLWNELFKNEEAKIKSTIAKMFDIFCEPGRYDMQEVKAYCIEMVLWIQIKAKELNPELLEDTLFNDSSKIWSFTNIRKLQKWVCTKFIELSNIMKDNPNTERNQYVKKAKNYIEQHYEERIRLEDMAKNLHVNANYFSSLFKRETGQNFIDYINQIRIHKAMELLQKTEDKIFEISIHVGYSNFSYFNKIFKRYTNMTPQSYRAKTQKHLYRGRNDIEMG